MALITLAFAMQLLGLRGRDSYLDPQILAAYEALAAAPIEEGFSARAAEGRTCLLQAAVDELRRSKGRGTIQERGVDIEWALLPGALALLQEVWRMLFMDNEQGMPYYVCLCSAAFAVQTDRPAMARAYSRLFLICYCMTKDLYNRWVSATLCWSMAAKLSRNGRLDR